MSVCYEILKGFDLECKGAEFRKYFQNIVLVNKNDVKEFFIASSATDNRIWFNLKEDKTGFLFRSSENGGSINAEFSKSERSGIVYYSHKLQMPIVGVDESTKTMLKQLDMSNYFAAVHFKDGTIEIHGFNNGLKTDPYTYTPQGLGGGLLSLVSRYEEYDPPYTYFPSLSEDSEGWEQQAIEDFNNLFGNIPDIYLGDFSDDFSDDFDNIGSDTGT
jgi:hypothetical protein